MAGTQGNDQANVEPPESRRDVTKALRPVFTEERVTSSMRTLMTLTKAVMAVVVDGAENAAADEVARPCAGPRDSACRRSSCGELDRRTEGGRVAPPLLAHIFSLLSIITHVGVLRI